MKFKEVAEMLPFFNKILNMKKTLAIVIALAIFFCSSCNTQKSDASPKTVFIEFIKALKRNDFAKAQSLATPASSSTFLVLNFGKDKLEKILAKIDTTNLNIAEPPIVGEKATINYTEKISNTKANFILEKINGEWKVAFDLESILAMADNTNATSADLKIEGTDPLHNLDSMEKVLKQQMKGLNMNVDSFEKELKKLDAKDIDKLILKNSK